MRQGGGHPPTKAEIKKKLGMELHRTLHRLWLAGDDKSKTEFCSILQELAKLKDKGKHGGAYWLKRLNPRATKGENTVDEVCDSTLR